MTRILAVLSALALAAAAFAQNRSGEAYRPAVPAGRTAVYAGGYGYGYGGYGGATTAAGSALNGMASAISAAGDYNLSTSAAAINMTQAQKNEIENRKQWTETYFDMRATNRAAREAERGPRLSMEDMARIAQSNAPKPLSPSALDEMAGTLKWPGVLTTDDYAEPRSEIDQLAAKRVTLGSLGYSDQSKARAAVDDMFATLKSQIQQVPTSDYLAAREFLQSLKYTICRSWLN